MPVKALPETILLEASAAQDAFNKIIDAIKDRVEYVVHRINYHSGNTHLEGKKFYPWGLDSDSDRYSLNTLRNDKTLYYEWGVSVAGDTPNKFKVSIQLDPLFSADIDVTEEFPTSWLFNDSFEEELCAGRERYLQKQKDAEQKEYELLKMDRVRSELVASAILKLTQEELKALQEQIAIKGII